MQTPESVAEKFRHFGTIEASHSSPLYAALATRIADDPDVIALACHAGSGQPAPNLLYGAVHYLLLRGATSGLARYYPSIDQVPLPPAEAFPAFREFALSQAGAIRQLLIRRFVQTNEVQRCAYLLPACVHVARLAGSGHGLGLIEIGASAGLNLRWDRYAYRYALRGSSLVAHGGRFDAPVRVESQFRNLSPALEPLPAITCRIGIDINVLDVTNADDRLWLRALIWPEHAERVARLEAALNDAQTDPPAMLQGDAAERWHAAVSAAGPDCALVAFHTHVLNQLSAAERKRLAAAMAATSASRDVYELGNDFEFTDGVSFRLVLRRWRSGVSTEMHLANVDGHAKWVEWLA